MTTKTITIDRVEDLQDGDIATFNFYGHEYTGPAYIDHGDLIFCDRIVIWKNGEQAPLAARFVKATREIPTLPTEPLSVITDVVIDTGRRFSHAVLTKEKSYDWLATDGTYYRTLQDNEIVSFKLGKVVAADG